MSYVDGSIGGNTLVSSVGAGQAGATSAGSMSLPNGAGLPGANLNMTTSVLIPLGIGVGGLVALYALFRREGGGLPPLRVDAANALNVYFSWLLIQTPFKLLAYKYHAHKVAQAYLLVA